MQFSNEPKRCHHTEKCDNEGTIFRDYTRGPLYDPRWFCDKHIEEADAVQQRISREVTLSYQRSIIANLEKTLEDARTKLLVLEEEDVSAK